MTLTIYLIRRFSISLITCGGISFSIFFVFSLIGNLSEKFSFQLILYLSALNAFQIFTFIPSHIFILSFCLFIIHLKSKNELIIIKEYIELRNLFLIILPILASFTFIEINKENFSKNIEKIKSDLISSKNLEDTKILISSEGNKKKYTIFTDYDEDKTIINQYLNIETLNQTIIKGEISTDLIFLENNLYSNQLIIYENNDFQQVNHKKEIFENFFSFWSTNSGSIIKKKENGYNSNYKIFKSFLFFILFYFCISMIFLSKRIVERGMNVIKIFLLILSIFLYYLIVPKIMVNNFQLLFQFISILIFILIFLKVKQYE
jgi:hypothetical protein